MRTKLALNQNLVADRLSACSMAAEMGSVDIACFGSRGVCKRVPNFRHDVVINAVNWRVGAYDLLYCFRCRPALIRVRDILKRKHIGGTHGDTAA